MKSNKLLLGLSATFLLATSSLDGQAQIGKGGFPLSFKQSTYLASSGDKLVFENAKFAELLKNPNESNTERYEVGWGVAANVNLLEKGNWTYLENGRRLFTVKVSVPNAKALGLYFKQFHLPKGVDMFLYSENKRQVLGAFSENNNTETGVFSTQALVGDVATLELNVEQDIDISKIKLDLDFIGAYYRGVEQEMALYSTGDVPLLFDPPIGATASCHINAMCPDAEAGDKGRKATLRIVIAYAANQPMGFCSGTLINNTGNTAENCKALFLTASHCDGNNEMTDAGFQYWQFRFNYQLDGCTTGTMPTEVSSPTLTGGAKYKSRSYYPTFPSSDPESSSLVQDFLLLELNEAIPSGYYLAGWNRANNLSTDIDYYSTFYGYHHPSGDIKKQSIGYTVTPNGTFNQNTVQGTHWSIGYTRGGTSPGSSGSGLFDVDGLLVGDLSGGASGTCSDNKKYGQAALYSKLSYGWENSFDQTNFPAHAGASSRLKDHLDPLNIGINKLAPTIAGTCTDMPNVSVDKKLMEGVDLFVFPNPSKDGKISVQVNHSKVGTFDLAVVDINGRTLRSYKFDNSKSNLFSIDLSDLSNGVYFLKVASSIGVGNHKFLINK